MIVIDASAVIELVLNTVSGQRVAERIRSTDISLHAPHLIDLEIAQVLRRLRHKGTIARAQATQALRFLQELDLHRYPHDLLLDRIWALRQNLTAYDAAYVALAEALPAPLLTGDRRIATAPGHVAVVEIAQ